MRTSNPLPRTPPRVGGTKGGGLVRGRERDIGGALRKVASFWDRQDRESWQVGGGSG